MENVLKFAKSIGKTDFPSEICDAPIIIQHVPGDTLDPSSFEHFYLRIFESYRTRGKTIYHLSGQEIKTYNAHEFVIFPFQEKWYLLAVHVIFQNINSKNTLRMCELFEFAPEIAEKLKPIPVNNCPEELKYLFC